MRLIRLKLENFRQHKNTDIEFRDGMTAIVGANGTGKTTLLEAITYALYGRQRDTKDTIRFYWSDPSRRKYQVSLTFEFDGRRFVVERSNSDALLSVLCGDEAKPRAAGQVEVKNACAKLLGLTYEQFKNSFCAEQKKLGFLDFDSNVARQDEIARMLGFDKLKAAEALARERRTTLRACAEMMEHSLGDKSQLEAERSEATARLAEAKKTVGCAQGGLAELERQIPPAAELRLKAEQWRKLNEELIGIRERAEGLKAAEDITHRALEEAKGQVAELARLRPSELEYQRLAREAKAWESKREKDRQREKLVAELEAATKETEELDAALSAAKLPDLGKLEKQLAAAGSDHERAQEALREQEKAWSTAQSLAREALALADTHLRQATQALARYEEMIARGECPECGQPIAKGFKTLAAQKRQEAEGRRKDRDVAAEAAKNAAAKPTPLKDAERALPAAKKKLEQAREACNAAMKAHEVARTLAGERQKKAARIKALEAQVSKTPAVYDAASHRAVVSSIERLEPTHRSFIAIEGAEAALQVRQKAHVEAAAAVKAANERYRQIEAEMKQLPFANPVEVEHAIASYHRLDIERQALDKALKAAKEMASLAAKALEQADTRLTEHKARAKELADTRRSELLHEIVARELKNLREALNRSIRPELEARASENLNILTNGRYPVLMLDANFEPTVIEEGVSKDVISGGEEDVVALALRLALSELIQERQGTPMALLILDEVFGSLDVERRQTLLDRLAALKGRFTQIFVISHIEEINQVADHAIYLSRDPQSHATVVADAPRETGALLL